MVGVGVFITVVVGVGVGLFVGVRDGTLVGVGVTLGVGVGVEVTLGLQVALSSPGVPSPHSFLAKTSHLYVFPGLASNSTLVWGASIFSSNIIRSGLP